MLEDLIVEDLGVIEHAEVALTRGSTAITGETGAGKTLMVAALGLLRGGRADRGAVRTGAEAALVEGRFTLAPDHPVVERLIEHGLVKEEIGDDPVEVVVTRKVSRDSSKARINGRLVTVAILAEVVGELVEIAGQNEHQRIGDPQHQRYLLDRSAGPEAIELSEQVATLVGSAAEAQRKGQALKDAERERSRELDVLRYETNEIAAANLEPGEWERLNREARRLESAEFLATETGEIVGLLRDESGVEELLGAASTRLLSLAEVDESYRSLADRLEAARIDAVDVAHELARARTEPDPDALADVRQRLDVINRLRRKYGDEEQTILTYLQEASARALELESAASDADMWLERSEELTRQARDLAERLSELRRDAARRLEREIDERLEALAMAGARFQVVLEPRDLYPGGLETVTFCASANRGQEPRPISKAVSGGELSRIALALHLACNDRSATTMVFDEVDAGIGGKAAQEVGRSLAALAEDPAVQVVVVTHLPQVAAFA
ncbi:MAG: DNA repair protein RecN, partial [Actinomycetota bacterium]